MGIFSMPMTNGALGESTDTLGGISGWLVTKTAPDAAVEFLMHMVSSEYQNDDASKGAYIPVVLEQLVYKRLLKRHHSDIQMIPYASKIQQQHRVQFL